ncbi:hypothetical protein Pla123a_31340 [Posidoniimonas polymericola]|uniref:DUF4404 domain-containing protein n=1 Tax=Posidoniimonas polymericola TaxID=2528002 RepID=A0A5C5YL88_9BACT|nr:DUF4404 family protein [Posidoniimonas polymericola]TWT75624.1 hypothetical protein Pla123a_31340 [Posidoniimonas polymericola]
MTHDELVATLNKLQAELAQDDSINASTREAFARVAADIQRVTDPDQPTTDEDAAAGREGLNGMVTEFEVEHPQISAMIGRIADALAQLGI